MATGDFEILAATIAELKGRAISQPALSTYDDPWGYGIRYFSAAVIRRTRQKYGCVGVSTSRQEAA